LGKTYPALEVRCDDADLVLALIDDFHPTAVEQRDGAARVFFTSAAERDAAHDALETRYPVEPLEVADEDWARRSQENLQPVTIGRLTIFPTNPKSPIPNPCSIVIQPSMGFGTGHHATTQLCLEALQAIDLTGAHVLDVGTGSGVLAIAAVRLGAASALGIDVDEDAIAAARENLTLNPDVADRVSFDVADVGSLTSSGGFITVASGFSRTSGPPEGGPHVCFETASPLTLAPTIVTANLTGTLLVRTARTLIEAVGGGGTLVLSGLQLHERREVMDAFAGTSATWERTVEEWVGVAVKKT
jgi:ribosomal protein L11 methylase PrmA